MLAQWQAQAQAQAAQAAAAGAEDGGRQLAAPSPSSRFRGHDSSSRKYGIRNKNSRTGSKAGSESSKASNRGDPYLAFPAPKFGKISRVAHKLVLERKEDDDGDDAKSQTIYNSDGDVASELDLGDLDDVMEAAECDAEYSAAEYDRGVEATLQDGANEALPYDLPLQLEDTGDLIGSPIRTVPAFLQTNRLPAAMSPANADEVAETIASSPGPLGHSLSPEQWFDGLVVGYLADAWNKHATEIDHGVQAVVGTIEREHTDAIERISKIKDFDLPHLLKIAQEYTVNVRNAMVCFVRDVRDEEDNFSSTVFQNIRSVYKRGMTNTLKGKNKEMRTQLKQQEERFRQEMDRARIAAKHEQAQIRDAEQRNLMKVCEENRLKAHDEADAKVRAAEKVSYTTSRDLRQARHEVSILEAEIEALTKEKHQAEVLRQKYEKLKGIAETYRQDINNFEIEHAQQIRAMEDAHEREIKDLRQQLAKVGRA